MTPDVDVATRLQTAGVGTLGTSIFYGPEHAQRTSPTVPAAAIFVISSGGPAPEPKCHTSGESLYKARVQIIVRAATDTYQTGLTKARSVMAALQGVVLSGYVVCFLDQSEPIYIGRNAADQDRWSVNVTVWKQQA